jgi:superfamily II DNA/RNA helicase
MTLLTLFLGAQVACMVGGVNISKDNKHLNGDIDILVVTPGRMQDHLSNTPGCAYQMGQKHIQMMTQTVRM